MEDLLGHWAQVVALFIDYGAIVFVALAALDALVRAFVVSFHANPREHTYRPLRWMLARRLTLALELLIASDIIRTAIAPSWVELGQLAAIVVLRELINITLNRDIKDAGRDATASTA